MTLFNIITTADLADPVNFTFFLGAMAMTAAAAFFFLSIPLVDGKWKNSILV